MFTEDQKIALRAALPSTISDTKADRPDVEVIKSTGVTQVIVPEGMTYQEARAWLERKEKAENTVVGVNHVLDALPLEGAYAWAQACAERFGWQDMETIPGGFFTPDCPPTMVRLEVGPGEFVSVPWGRSVFPGIDGYVDTNVDLVRGRPVCRIVGQCKRKHEQVYTALLARADQILASKSVYKGRALRVSFPDWRKTTGPDDFSPRFVDLSGVAEDDLVLPGYVNDTVRASLFAPIEHSQACRDHGIPLKRGVLLHGEYGTGKTLTAKVAARKCEANGWTFLYLDDVAELAAAIEFARKYQPCMIFAEDVDRVMGEDRDEETNAILNTLDGIDSKSAEILVVLTTNHLERINPAMLRPGRLDAVIHIGAPDAAAAARLVRNYTGNVLHEDDLAEVGRVLAGHNPAIIREACERAKLFALANHGDPTEITSDDLLAAARGMAEQVARTKVQIEDKREPIERAAETIAMVLRNGHNRPVLAADLAT